VVEDNHTGRRRRLAAGELFVLTGADARRDADRRPFLLETSHPGVFAVGDVRSGSIKRVTSAVGEGALAVRLVHEYLEAGPPL
jgi:thioredoxin reductase (NADPH)